MKKYIGAFTLLISCAIANAQKLPNVQTASIPAPTGIKVDGKPTEWANGLQALNHATGIYYTIANDAENLYLIVQGTDVHTVEKIISGGVTFTIKNSDKKNNAQPAAITFPFILPKDRFPIVQAIKDKNENTPFNQDELNKQLASAEKEIDVRGIKEIQDTVISVYNDAGIIAVTRIDSKKVLTYELSIPLKYLQQNIDNASKLSYNIRLNPPRTISRAGMGMVMVVGVSSIRRDSPADSDFQDLMNATDFSGTYVLAKK
ncbi:hypothetical protein KXQ82_05290 [Mucilaginibacter sp. HMF5004]|uniref:hypothetical protein n=1 Tax=Mucilaginibacter rivuli TaxID=2857527 RepID=UPI001C5F6D52|nr:hypothetical protein [Mucilaginibacter rivuli]MBW4889116.1 hypothetical protein [Mucilaginibacter rivuli]